MPRRANNRPHALPALLMVAAAFFPPAATGADPNFNRDIRPILSENCFFCHGPDAGNRKADLRLDTFEGATADLDGVRAIVPGDAAASALVDHVLSSDPDEVMPPPEAKISLGEREKTLLVEWVRAGAQYQPHWAFVAPRRARLDGARNPVDQIVARQLAATGRQLAAEAAPATLIRRISLDLTGLPPTPGEVAAFVADRSPGAYAKVVDRLLASPAYGERMAWDWLDAARYADSNGYQGDNERTMWPWRDWVVAAFNANLPYDQFTTWQLAGDLLPDATHEQILATGFLRNHAINGEGGRIPEENRVDYVMDMTETTGTVWLGLTLNCCRCHDHKFDPISQREYYQFSAFFNQTPVTGEGKSGQQPPVLATPSHEAQTELARLARSFATTGTEIGKRRDQLARAAPGSPAAPWTVLVPETAVAQTQTLAIRPDRSVLSGGSNPANDTYTVRATTDLEQIAAIRLETLMHPSMTGGGLARSNSGNFVLTDLAVSLRRPGEAEPTPVTIANAEATFEQGSHKVTNAYDDNTQSGWAVYEGRTVDREHAAVFRFAKPVRAGAGSVLTFVLKHDSPHASHNLGRFRISASARPDAGLGTRQEVADATLAALIKKKADLEARQEKLTTSAPKVMVMADMPETRPTYILGKGSYSNRGEKVVMGTPAALPPMPGRAPQNRLGLARWLVSDTNPLTARVTVNRLWQGLFGIGLVKTPEDFGTQGEIPPMQELLDHLAVEFQTGGWDIKALLRLIVTSDTYRQSSRSDGYAADPENRLLARGPRLRMPSWMLRDGALAASSLLARGVGGPPVNPYQPDGIWEEASFGKKEYRRDSGADLYRRSLYTFWRRIVAPPAFFDNAGRQVCSVKPFRTNTPLHALYTFNDTTFVEAARAIAQDTLHAGGDDREQLDHVFHRVLARHASDAEAAALLRALVSSRARYAADPAAAAALLAIGESPRDAQLDSAEHAAWTALALAVLNLDETLTKE